MLNLTHHRWGEVEGGGGVGCDGSGGGWVE